MEIKGKQFQTAKSAEVYHAPSIRLYKVKVRAVLCQSIQSATNDGYESNDYQW